MEPLLDVKTTAELITEGTTPPALSRRVQRGELIKLRHGVYIPRETWQELGRFERCLAHHTATVKTGKGTVLGHLSAALAYGVLPLNLPSHVHCVSASQYAKNRGAVRIHRCSPDALATSRWINGWQVTSPLQTFLDCARTLPHRDAVCVADQLLHKGLLTRSEIEDALPQVAGSGASRVRKVAQQMSEHAESVAETLVRLLLHEWGVVMPSKQVQLVTASGARYRPDFVWESLRLILEVDGEVKYSGTYGSANEVIRKEHRRQRELEREGWTFVRVRWAEIVNSPWTLRQALAEHGVPVQY